MSQVRHLQYVWLLRGVLLMEFGVVWWSDKQGGRGGGSQNRGGVREKEDISLELVSVGRGWALFQLAWQLYQGMYVTGGLGGVVHWATALNQSNVITLVDSLWQGVSDLLKSLCLCFLSLQMLATRHLAFRVCESVFMGVISPDVSLSSIAFVLLYFGHLC